VLPISVHIPVAPETRHYTDPGCCIYCGERDQQLLTDEHIIPMALRGTLIFDNASCRSCAKIVNVFETYVLRGTLMDARRHFDLKGRKHQKSPQPERRLGRFKEDGSFERWEPVNPVDDPVFVAFPMLSPPSIVLGQQATTGFTVHGINTYSTAQSSALLKKAGRGAAKVQPIRFDYFARFLAKIAHGVAVAELGDALVDRFLPEIILGQGETPSHYIGSWLSEGEAADTLHSLSIGSADGYVAVDIRLLANTNAPSYLVVAGRFRSQSLNSASM
jgi:HNH endonuclease